MKLAKEELDAALLVLLGPKTAADAPVKKDKKKDKAATKDKPIISSAEVNHIPLNILYL